MFANLATGISSNIVLITPLWNAMSRLWSTSLSLEAYFEAISNPMKTLPTLLGNHPASFGTLTILLTASKPLCCIEVVIVSYVSTVLSLLSFLKNDGLLRLFIFYFDHICILFWGHSWLFQTNSFVFLTEFDHFEQFKITVSGSDTRGLPTSLNFVQLLPTSFIIIRTRQASKKSLYYQKNIRIDTTIRFRS